MNNNNSLKILPVLISIVVFIVLMFGAGYAFFAASMFTNNVTNISATLPKMTTLDTVTTDCGIVITPDMMTLENANRNYTNNCSINVTINGSNTATCTYDIFVEEINTPNYEASTGVGEGVNEFEFTGSISGSATTNEIQMDTLSGNNILTGETITVVVDDTPVTKSYTITEKWYNLNLDQDKHSNKSYFYKFKVANVVC